MIYKFSQFDEFYQKYHEQVNPKYEFKNSIKTYSTVI